jgi:hypothetical protein
MKEVNLKINADTAQATSNMDNLASASKSANQEMLSVADTAFTVAETISGSFAIATGAIGLLAGENENLQRIAVKAQSAIAIAIGVRQLAEQRANLATLKGTIIMKAQAAATKVAAVAQGLFSLAIAGSSKAFKVMKLAIVSTGIGALVVMLGMVIAKLMDMGDKADESASKFHNLEDAIKATKKETEDLVNLNEQLNASSGEVEDALIHERIAYKEAKEELDTLIRMKEAEILTNEIMGTNMTKHQKAYDAYIIALDKQHENLLKNEQAFKDLNKTQNTHSGSGGTQEKTKKLTEEQIELMEFELASLQLLNAELLTSDEQKMAMAKKRKQQLEEAIANEEEGTDKHLQLQLDLEKELNNINNMRNANEQKLADERQKRAEEEKTRKEEEKQDAIDLANEQIEIMQAESDAQQGKFDVAKSVTDGIVGLAEEGTALQKSMALVAIGIDTAQAISALVKGSEIAAAQAATAVPGPAAAAVYTATKAALWASGIAQIMGNIAQAKAILQGGDETGATGGGGGPTYIQPYVPESAAQGGGVPETGEGGSPAPLQAYVVTGDVTNAQNVEQQLQQQSSL